MVKGSKNCRKREQELSRFKTLLGQLKTDDFDGHTDFDKLSYEQKLCWLSCCADFLNQVKRENSGLLPLPDKIRVNSLAKGLNNGKINL